MFFEIFVEELTWHLDDQNVVLQFHGLDRLKPCFVMLPLDDVLDYFQAITPNFVKRFCHYTITNCYADLRIVIFKNALRNWILKKLCRAANIKTFRERKNFLFTCFFCVEY